MSINSINQQKALEYARQHGPFRPKDVAALGVHPEDIRRLCQKGQLVRLGRGLYQVGDAEISRYLTFVQACTLVPRGVVCLLSALGFHEIGTQLPHRVWLAIPAKAARPQIDSPRLELTYLKERMYRQGIEKHQTPAGVVRVYSVAKTIVDCFRFRNKVGIDVAVEALREVVYNRRQYGVTPGQLAALAAKCRVGDVMKPYIEALIA